ncbi:ATP12 family chaperone protein [Sphingomonas bacterium]|uniref:ATP12 family chaperone protein n=1 Tax=Sphingomonas bacterium TaxID=1895847 RepID=UPI0026041E62|nr:ATP12 family protein [Sphingomonas bacterium]MDB5679377.1 ATPase [Sphingomonas bacterium]
MKRFWQDVGIDAERGIRLDGKPVRTPGRLPLVLPTDALAEAVADEWRRIVGEIDPRAMPLTGLANAAIERVTADPALFAATIAAYAESDLLCYRAEQPVPLVERQAELWNPPLAWASQRYDVHFAIIAGIIHQPQPDATIERLAVAVAVRDPFELAGLSPIVTITGSLVLGLALMEGAMEAETVWAAANLDEDWQAEQWGIDPLAVQAREVRRAEFDAAVRFLHLRQAADEADHSALA